MSNRKPLSLIGAAVFALTFSVSAASFFRDSQLAVAQQARSTFPDVPANYWARPFIQSLTEKGIVTGYPDGTFRPTQAVDRDEFSAMIRQAFDRSRIRNIPSGSYFKDVPQNYWAETPIQEAYEMGFMNNFPGNEFRPKQPLTKAQALVVLMRGLNIDFDRPVTPTNRAAATPTSPTPADRTPANQRRRIARNRLAFPLAGTVLMQPILPAIAQQPPAPAPAPAPANAVPQTTTTTTNDRPRISALEFLQSYYKDADRIPKDAVNPVAAATQAKIAVNYPDPRVLNPNELLSRGSATALIHQALVDRGQIEPLQNPEAVKYIPNN
ncbi:MAG: S-layer homology domain-containing protein [Oscillatoriaceae cyanobacterium Prado104]|nr:S-layer homology domain-containing protein [Oscillatoriaceae cyanobacterium Prado104]